MTRISASSLGRAFACPGSLHLPIANTSSKDAREGTARHAEQEDAIRGRDLSRLPAELAALIPDGAVVRAEVAVAYDVSTGTTRELGTSIGRAYGTLAPFEIPGTIDLFATAPGFCLVADHKGHELVDPPTRNEQLLFGALCAAKLCGIDEAIAAISYLPTGEVVHATLDALDLDAFAARLRQLQFAIAAQAGKRPPDVSENKHCKYCPSAHVCPAKVSLVKQLARGEDVLLEPLTVDTAALAYERLGHAKRLLRRIEDAIFAFARDRPIPLKNGNVLGVHEKLGNETLDGDTVWKVVEDMFGRDVADAAVVRDATKKRLEEALKCAGVLPVAKHKAAVLAAVKKLGGIDRKRTMDVVEYPAEPALGTGDEAA